MLDHNVPIAPAARADRLDGCPPSPRTRDNAQTLVDAGVTTVFRESVAAPLEPYPDRLSPKYGYASLYQM